MSAIREGITKLILRCIRRLLQINDIVINNVTLSNNREGCYHIKVFSEDRKVVMTVVTSESSFFLGGKFHLYSESSKSSLALEKRLEISEKPTLKTTNPRKQ